MADEKKLIFWTRRQYGRLDPFIRDPEVAKMLCTIDNRASRQFDMELGEWFISWDEMEGLKQIGYSFRQIPDPAKKVTK